MTVLAIAGTRARQILRDRVSLFFLLVLPVLVIVIVGAIVGGFNKFRVGVIDLDGRPLSTTLVAQLEHSNALDVRIFTSVDTGKTALRRAEIATLVEIPAGTDARLRAGKTARDRRVRRAHQLRPAGRGRGRVVGDRHPRRGRAGRGVLAVAGRHELRDAVRDRRAARPRRGVGAGREPIGRLDEPLPPPGLQLQRADDARAVRVHQLARGRRRDDPDAPARHVRPHGRGAGDARARSCSARPSCTSRSRSRSRC